jgi:hypothetical protein
VPGAGGFSSAWNAVSTMSRASASAAATRRESAGLQPVSGGAVWRCSIRAIAGLPTAEASAVRLCGRAATTAGGSDSLAACSLGTASRNTP